MSLAVAQSEDFLLDVEQQFGWYIHESNLDLPDAVELAQKFKIAIVDTLEFLQHHPGL